MIKTSLCGLLFLSTTMMIQCMENNNSTIGYIDKLILQRLSEIDGAHTLEFTIQQHRFSTDTPFVIKCTVNKKERSALSNAVFRITDEHEVIFNSANPLNKKQNLLDHCTEWHQSRNFPDTTTLTTNFYDKATLLRTIRAIQSTQSTKK